MNQALLALRELLRPDAELAGEVVSVAAGICSVVTRHGTRDYPVAPGLSPAPGQRVTIQGGLVVRVIGAKAGVPTFYV